MGKIITGWFYVTGWFDVTGTLQINNSYLRCISKWNPESQIQYSKVKIGCSNLAQDMRTTDEQMRW